MERDIARRPSLILGKSMIATFVILLHIGKDMPRTPSNSKPFRLWRAIEGSVKGNRRRELKSSWVSWSYLGRLHRSWASQGLLQNSDTSFSHLSKFSPYAAHHSLHVKIKPISKIQGSKSCRFWVTQTVCQGRPQTLIAAGPQRLGTNPNTKPNIQYCTRNKG